MTRPFLPGEVPARAAAAAMAVCRGARTQREVADECGWKSLQTANKALHEARALDLVRFRTGPGSGGTLRPGVRAVPR